MYWQFIFFHKLALPIFTPFFFYYGGSHSSVKGQKNENLFKKQEQVKGDQDKVTESLLNQRLETFS